MEMKQGVLVNGEFEERETELMNAKGFKSPMFGRVDTYDHYVMKEINRSYGQLDVEGRVVLDIGANIGCFSCWALERNPLHVISIEPEKNNFKMLSFNMSTHVDIGLPETPYSLHHRGLTSDDEIPGILWLSTTGKNPGNSSTTQRRGRVPVNIFMMPVKELKEKHPVIDVAKVDCEGAEFDFMEELVLAYPNMKEVALEIHMSGFGLEPAEKLHQFMLEQGFDAVVPPRIQEGLWQTLATYKR